MAEDTDDEGPLEPLLQGLRVLDFGRYIAGPFCAAMLGDLGAEVVRIERLLNLAEYNRRQAPPGVKLGSRNFGRDRRYPITHAFRTA